MYTHTRVLASRRGLPRARKLGCIGTDSQAITRRQQERSRRSGKRLVDVGKDDVLGPVAIDVRDEPVVGLQHGLVVAVEDLEASLRSSGRSRARCVSH